jgi:hypothetical protein
MSRYELAQFNVGIIKGPLDWPVATGVAINLNRINAQAGTPELALGDECPAA